MKTPTAQRRAMAEARRAATGRDPEAAAGSAPLGVPALVTPNAVGTEPQGVPALGTPGPARLTPDIAAAADLLDPLTPSPDLDAARALLAAHGSFELPQVTSAAAPKVTLARIAVGPQVRTQAILDAWLGDCDDRSELHPDGPEAARWFGTDLALEHDIGTRFAADLRLAAAAGRRDLGPHQTLAHVILCDPLARRIHRDSPEMYATDTLARNYCLHALRNKHHRAFNLPERLMLALPLMHAERPALQDAAVRYLEHLALLARERCPASTLYAFMLGRARRQREIIRAFGRFPHRNALLGRTSTPAERAFMHLGEAG